MEKDDNQKKSFFSRHKYWIIPLAIVLGIVLFLVTGSILLFVIYFISLYISYRYLKPEEKGFASYAKRRVQEDFERIKAVPGKVWSRFKGKGSESKGEGGQESMLNQ